MQSTQTNECTGTRLGNLYRRWCQTILKQIRKARNAILAESLELVPVPERMVRLALNEAEALAWQTPFPHLVFPDLATEKIKSIANWIQHQQSIRSFAE